MILNLLLLASTFLISEIRCISCFSCTSFVEEECDILYGYFSTYRAAEAHLKRTCPLNVTSCGTYIWATGLGDTFIQRGCVNGRREEYCSSVSRLLSFTNLSIFNPATDCHTCNNSLCNYYALSDLKTSAAPNFFIPIATALAIVQIVLSCF